MGLTFLLLGIGIEEGNQESVQRVIEDWKDFRGLFGSLLEYRLGNG